MTACMFWGRGGANAQTKYCTCILFSPEPLFKNQLIFQTNNDLKYSAEKKDFFFGHFYK